ncbi:MAG: hypothetical protein JSS42_01320 [Proteobacteria bacterium]|uniref:hypothetical protein n=1 Tax=Rudaea sp. TaxID=2136325 RepID=UPI00321F7115|nr:hypothetical protein [Pseudomonadota bacterium]
MKRSIFLAAGMSLALAGCAATGGARHANDGYGSDVDMGKVVAVNQWAETKGARIMWINLPQKPKNLDSAGSVN